MTYDEVVTMALQLPGVAESKHYGYLAVKRDKRFMFGLRHPDEDVACFQVSWDDNDRFLAEYPAVVYKIPHYDGHPAFLVRLELVKPELAQALVAASYASAPNKPMTRPRSTL